MPKSQLEAQAFSEFASSRRTTRDFLPTPVPQELLDRLLTDAMSAPSWSNTRPYLIGIAQGEKLQRISTGFLSRWAKASAGLSGGLWAKAKLFITRDGLPTSDYKMTLRYPADIRPRSQKVGSELYGMLGIERSDRKGRDEQWGKNYEFFGAPVSLFIFTHSGIGVHSVSDAGLFMQNLMLSAHAHGLGSCAQGASAIWADVVRSEFDVPKDYKLLCGIAIGYASDAPINSFEAERLDISQIKLKG
jgi:nitroreductase